MAATSVHVSINPETIASIGPFDISNSIFTGLIVTALIIGFSLYFSTIKMDKKKVGGIQNLIELIVEKLYNLCTDIAGPKKGRDFFPFIATAFIFIILNNWIGLLPGVGTILIKEPVELAETTTVYAAETTEDSHTEDSVADAADETHTEGKEEHHEPIPILRAATADLNGTIALALISMFLVQYYGVKYQGMHYFKKFFNFSDGPIFTFVGILELLSDISKIISFAFRLFGNIFAGEVLLAVIFYLTQPYAAGLGTIPFIGLEIFVGFIQALVFAMLSLVFINMATVSHDH